MFGTAEQQIIRNSACHFFLRNNLGIRNLAEKCLIDTTKKGKEKEGKVATFPIIVISILFLLLRSERLLQLTALDGVE